MNKIAKGGSSDPFQVDPVVLIKAPVLDGHEGFFHDGRDLVGGYGSAILVEQGCHQGAVGRKYLGCLCRVVFLKFADIGQVGGHGADDE